MLNTCLVQRRSDYVRFISVFIHDLISLGLIFVRIFIDIIPKEEES